MPPPACLFAFQGARTLGRSLSHQAPHLSISTPEPAGSSVGAGADIIWQQYVVANCARTHRGNCSG